MIHLKPNKFFSNFFSLLGGQSLSLIFNFLSITLIARYLGVDIFGVFSYILAIVSILSKIVDLGIGPIAFRETSKKENDPVFLNTAISVRVILFIIVLAVFNLAAQLLALTAEEILLADILFFNIIISAKFQNVRDLLDIPFKISLSSYISVIGSTLDNIIFLALVLLMPVLKLIYYM